MRHVIAEVIEDAASLCSFGIEVASSCSDGVLLLSEELSRGYFSDLI